MTKSFLPTFQLEEENASQYGGSLGVLHSTEGSLPLEVVSISAQIAGLGAKVKLDQTFANHFEQPIEATYIFPLPDRGAVTSFSLWVAGREVQGILKERGEARATYEKAISEGKQAALLEEDRRGTFHLQVGNLPPGESVTVQLCLMVPLDYHDGEAEFRFPLVVAPRYHPGNPVSGESVGHGVHQDTEFTPDASRISPPLLLKNYPYPVQLSLEVVVDADSYQLQPEELASKLCSSQQVLIGKIGSPIYLQLQPGERMDRDFILRLKLGSDHIQSYFFLEESALEWGERNQARVRLSPGTLKEPRHFEVLLLPPKELPEVNRPRDVVFVLDRSYSMNGWKMVAARRATGRMIDSLLDHDRFHVVAFDNTVLACPETERNPTFATNQARYRAIEWLSSVKPSGGTDMQLGLKRAFAWYPPMSEDRDRVLVLITDGQVGNEDHLLQLTSQYANGHYPHVFALGIDQAVNAGFLRRMAELSGGCCEFVESENRLDESLQAIHRSLQSPVLRKINVQAKGGMLLERTIAPQLVPDLFPGRPLQLFGKLEDLEKLPQLVITGIDQEGETWEVELDATTQTRELIAHFWGRRRVRDLEDQYASHEYSNGKELTSEIVQTSLETQVLSRFTAFVAVDHQTQVDSNSPLHRITQPVESPAGWEDKLCDDPGVMYGGMAPACPSDLSSPRSTDFMSALSERTPAPKPGKPQVFRKRKAVSRGTDTFEPVGRTLMRQKSDSDQFGLPSGSPEKSSGILGFFLYLIALLGRFLLALRDFFFKAKKNPSSTEKQLKKLSSSSENREQREK
ncbi:Marine proteobacterial sortase target protein [Planctomycetales bacterium 10988]|nr:Marine proteobacterial sortase target protein [Planctomycetales bacterium 10988]